MPNNLKLLEELIGDAIGRMESLTAERDGLRGEVATLRERLEAAEREASRSDRGAGAERAWRAQQAQALSLVREVRQSLSELRAE